MDMKKILSAIDKVDNKNKTSSNDMKKFLSIINESATNRLSMAEQMTVQHYQEPRKDITSPVLNKDKDAKPSMIGKYFKKIEEEIAESEQRYKDRAKQIAERVANKLHNTSKQRIQEYYNFPTTDSKSPISGKHVDGCKCSEVEEGLRDPKDNPCWKGYKPVGTKKKGGRTVPNCVPKEGVAEGMDYSKRTKLIRYLAKKLDIELNYLELASDDELVDLYKKSKDSMSESKPKGYDSEGNPQGGGYDEYENNWLVTVNGKPWKTFQDEKEAYRVAAAIERKHGKKTSVHRN